MGKYFKVDAKPLIPASLQHSNSNMTVGKVLADWTEFEVPRGAAKLIGINILFKGVNGADVNPTDFEIIWAKGNPDGSAPTSLVAAGAVVAVPAVGSPPWYNLLQGRTYIDATETKDAGNLLVLRQMSPPYIMGGKNTAQQTSGFSLGGNTEIVLEGEPNSGSNVGYDKLYCAIINAATSPYTTSTLNSDGIHAITQNQMTVATIDARLAFAPGDVMHDENDRLMGTVKSVDSATVITFEDNLANASVDAEHMYNANPMVFQLSFEK